MSVRADPAGVGGPGFPFVAVVGLEEVKMALLIGAVERRLGGVLLRGEKGSAKTTLARGLAELLPGDPPPPFVELPIGATEDRVVGTLDLAAALREGEPRFRPGLLAAAHGGIVYVDEVNLLPDHLVDVLLDVAVSGVNRVERDAVSYQHESSFFLVGSMNPEEGELRPQLLDRFGLSVDVRSSPEPSERAEAVRRRLAFDADPVGYSRDWVTETAELAARLGACKPAELPQSLVEAAAAMAVALGADGLRADLALCRAAAAHAGLGGRREATLEDLRAVAPLALGHRRRRGPFDQPGVSEDELDEALEEALRRPSSSDGRGTPETPPEPEGGAAGEAGPGGGDDGRPSAGRSDDQGAGCDKAPSLGSPPPSAAPPPSAPPPSDVEGTPVPLPLPTDTTRRQAGSSVRGPSSGRAHGRGLSERIPSGRGRVVGGVPAGPSATRLAVAATVARIGERRMSLDASGDDHGSGAVEMSDVLEAVTELRPARLVVICVDTSGSMGAEERSSAARGAVLRLLTDAYQQRDRVAVVSFSGAGVELALRPTASIEIARARLEELRSGGRTPLAGAILRGLEVCLAPATVALSPVLVLISDGRATAGPPGQDPVDAALEASDRVAAAGVPCLVVDVEAGRTALRLGEELAVRMGARYVRLESANADGIERAVRSVLSEIGR